MRILSVSEFYDWVHEQPPNNYIFSTENNPSFFDSMLRLSLHFQHVTAIVHPSRICFRNNLDSLTLECVKEVHMYDDRESVGVVFEILCEGGVSGTNVYRFLADKIL